jgi:hypothetical protein
MYFLYENKHKHENKLKKEQKFLKYWKLLTKTTILGWAPLLMIYRGSEPKCVASVNSYRDGERSLFGFGNWVTTLGGLIVFMWDTQEISP